MAINFRFSLDGWYHFFCKVYFCSHYSPFHWSKRMFCYISFSSDKGCLRCLIIYLHIYGISIAIQGGPPKLSHLQYIQCDNFSGPPCSTKILRGYTQILFESINFGQWNEFINVIAGHLIYVDCPSFISGTQYLYPGLPRLYNSFFLPFLKLTIFWTVF